MNPMRRRENHSKFLAMFFKTALKLKKKTNKRPSLFMIHKLTTLCSMVDCALNGFISDLSFFIANTKVSIFSNGVTSFYSVLKAQSISFTMADPLKPISDH